MQATQSSTAYVETPEFAEFDGVGEGGAYAALKLVNRRCGLKVIETAGEQDVAGDGVVDCIASHAGGVTVSGATPGLISESIGLAHDVGNLLGALSLYADLLSCPGVLHEDYREYAADLRLLSERSSEMVSRLFRCAEGHAARRSEERAVIPDVLRGMHGLLERLARLPVELEFMEGSEWPLGVSREVIERIAANLVKNAGEAADRETGSISIRVDGTDGPEGKRVIMSFCDDGRGMTRAQLDSLGGEARRAGGRGIGFPVVQELVALSDGVLSIASALGKGTVVEVEWRAAAPHMVTQGEAGRIGY